MPKGFMHTGNHSLLWYERVAAANKRRKGIPHTEEHKAKIRITCNTEEVRTRLKASLSGRTSSFKGKHHSDEAKAKLSANKRGRRLSPETKAKISASVRALGEEWRAKLRKRWLNQDFRLKMAIAYAEWRARFPKPKTALEYALSRYLEEQDLGYVEQKQFGRYIVDAYVPAHNIAYEADGEYWHKDKERQAQRDAYLLKCGIRAIIHLSEHDLLSASN